MKKVPYHILSERPLVVVSYWDAWAHWDSWKDRQVREPFGRIVGNRPCTVLLIPMWSKESPIHLARPWLSILRHRRTFPNHRLVVLCNTEMEKSRLDAIGVEGIFCNHNALHDTSRYRILPEEKRYDAIYNAQMAPFKRHHLAQDVASLVLVTYFDGLRNANRYYQRTRRQLAHATWLNEPLPDGHLKWIASEQIVAAMNRSRVGLCLSRIEGAMYASIEYLLCGLPIVSTKSRGGRDVFFDERYVGIVPADRGAVRQGVEEMIRKAPAPELVRAETIRRIEEHRDRLRSLLDDVCDRSGLPRNGAEIFRRGQVDKMIRWQNWSALEEVVARISSSDASQSRPRRDSVPPG